MADLKISDLTSIAAATTRADLLHVIDDPSGTPANTKVTIGEMMNSLHAPVKLAAGDLTLTEATHAGRMLIVPNQASSAVLTLPTPKIGMSMRFTYGGIAADAQNTAISAGTGNSLFFLGSIFFSDSDNAHSVVYSDNDSNELITLVTPSNFDILCVGISATTWQISGYCISATTPAIQD
jgi:hypothetical protein|tara:strand:+ start:3530 stop:4069 length:540 start_codon:yes stop_codon:yes gene_type:complete